MADDVNAILTEFERLKQACQEMAGKKITVGIIGGGETAKIAHIHEYGDGKMPEPGQTSAGAAANAIGAQAAQLVQNYIDSNRVTPSSDFSKKTQHTTLYETGTHIRDRIAFKVEG